MTSVRPADIARHVRPPAVVLDEAGRIVASSPAWLPSTPEVARQQSSVGDGADYLDVVRRAAARGDPDAAAVRDLIEDLVSGHATHGVVDYPCPSPVAHRWFRLTAIRLADDHVLLVHTPTVAPHPGGTTEGTVTDDVAHDLTRPLDTARGLVETVLERGDAVDPATRDEALRAAYRQLDHALEVLADLRAPKPMVDEEAAPRPAQVADVVAEAAGTAGIESHVTGDVDALVRCDPGHLDRVLVNLFDNAAKYGRPPVEVGIRREGQRVLVEVHDHGEGIPADVVDALFTPRRRGAQHRASDLPGTGLGLSIVRDLLRVNAGTIVHRPDLPGAGFQIDLPAGEPEGA